MNRTLIFGGTGSLGKKLVSRLRNTDKICVASRDEEKHWSMRNSGYNDIEYSICDIRDISAVDRTIKSFKPDSVIIASAMKHIDACEKFTHESINTNVIGVDNVLKSCNGNAENVLFVSTDKACLPINTYGMCKALSEKLTTNYSTSADTKYVIVRYGNVLESRGSIIPLFKKQCTDDRCDSITVTDRGMTRYLMTLDQSVDLIQFAMTSRSVESGSVCVSVMESMNIGDLADIFSELYNKQIRITGVRPGEKMHEDLISEQESMFCTKTGEYYVIGKEKVSCDQRKHTSRDAVLTKNELLNKLKNFKVL